MILCTKFLLSSIMEKISPIQHVVQEHPPTVNEHPPKISPIEHVVQQHSPKVQEHPAKTLQPLCKWDDSHSTSVEIIEFGPFSPYKSHISLELSDEIRKYERGRKRALSLKNWKWDDVIAIDSLEDTDLEDDLDDTAGSLSPPKKIPKITIHKRHRVLLLRDEPDDEDVTDDEDVPPMI